MGSSNPPQQAAPVPPALPLSPPCAVILILTPGAHPPNVSLHVNVPNLILADRRVPSPNAANSLVIVRFTHFFSRRHRAASNVVAYTKKLEIRCHYELDPPPFGTSAENPGALDPSLYLEFGHHLGSLDAALVGALLLQALLLDGALRVREGAGAKVHSAAVDGEACRRDPAGGGRAEEHGVGGGIR